MRDLDAVFRKKLIAKDILFDRCETILFTGHRKDGFGVFDYYVIANNKFYCVQLTSKSNMSARQKKIIKNIDTVQQLMDVGLIVVVIGLYQERSGGRYRIKEKTLMKDLSFKETNTIVNILV